MYVSFEQVRMQVGNAEESLTKIFPSPSVAMLKHVIFNHLLSREAHDEADDRRHSGATEGQQGGAEESSASNLLAEPQRENNQLLGGRTEASDTTERNGEAANSELNSFSPLLTNQSHISLKLNTL